MLPCNPGSTGETNFVDAKCFWMELENSFVSRTESLCSQKVSRGWVNREKFVSEIMSPLPRR